jgi:hypothetical protein
MPIKCQKNYARFLTKSDISLAESNGKCEVMQAKYQNMGLVEYGVYNYPKGLEGWRFYRIEYGGHAESCIMEMVIWLPPGCDACELEELFEKWQIPDPT